MTAKHRLLNALKSGRTLTAISAFSLTGATSADRRLRELRSEYPVASKVIRRNGKRITQFRWAA